MNMPYQQPMMNYTPNYGTYQYNPMASYQRYQQPEPTQGISGRVVQAVETINPNEVPMDGSVAFFPKQDLTEIYAKSWNTDGTISLGVTDNTTKTVTIADNVSDYMADKILCHELVHVYSFSYGCDIDMETEEIIADFMSLYGRNIVYTADKIFNLLEQKYG